VAKARKKKQPFDVKVFLNTVDTGRSVLSYRKNANFFCDLCEVELPTTCP
jgi:hypothetical protein